MQRTADFALISDGVSGAENRSFHLSYQKLDSLSVVQRTAVCFHHQWCLWCREPQFAFINNGVSGAENRNFHSSYQKDCLRWCREPQFPFINNSVSGAMKRNFHSSYQKDCLRWCREPQFPFINNSVSGAMKRSFHSSDQEELEEMNGEQHHRGPARHCTAERAVMLAPALTVSTRFCFWTISAVAS